MRSIIFYITVFILLGTAQVQVAAQPAYVEMDSEIHQLYDQYISSNKDERTDGWSVLVVNTQDRRALDGKITIIKARYKHYPYEWNFESPYYKLKVGAFRTRLEAKKFAQKIKKDFPRGLEVKANIKKSDFLKQDLD